MIYKRYLISEILKSAAAIFVVVTLIFASDCAVNYLGEATAGSLPPAMVGLLILLRVAIAMEVILPVTLFLAVIVALGRLYKDSEMTAFLSCGIGMPSVMKLVFVLSLPVAMVAACVSLCIRPDAWREIYRVMDEAEVQFDISRLNPVHSSNSDREKPFSLAKRGSASTTRAPKTSSSAWRKEKRAGSYGRSR